MTADEHEMLDALKDAVRWLDAIELKVGNQIIDWMPNNCLGRPGMRQIIARMERP